MNLEKIISDTLQKLDLNLVLRKDALRKMDRELEALSTAKEDEEKAVERQELSKEAILAIRGEIAVHDQREASLQGQLKSLQAMMVSEPVTPITEPTDSTLTLEAETIIVDEVTAVADDDEFLLPLVDEE